MRFTQIDYDQEVALIVVVTEQEQELEVGAAPMPRNRTANHASTPSLLLTNGTIVVSIISGMSQLMAIARTRDLDIMESEVLAEDGGMLGSP